MGGRVHGKVAIVTGAARGMGAVGARLLAEEGARVILGDINVRELRATCDSLVADGLDAACQPLDVASEQSWADLVSNVEERYGGVHVLVNNAGIGH